VDVRIITATNKNLDDLIEKDQFREDLYFRINVFPLNCPPLSDRREDIPLVVQHFIKQNAKMTGKRILGVTPEAMDLLTSYDWPGNIRELRNAMDYAFVLCPGGGIEKEHLPNKITSSIGTYRPINDMDRHEHKTSAEALLQILREVDWNQSAAARKLGVSRVTIWKRMKKYGLKRPG